MDEERPGEGHPNEGDRRLKLLAWLSPNFPVGGFAFSHGLEWAAEAGDLRDAATLRGWLRDLLRHGAPRADAAMLSLARRQPGRLDALNELALALAPSAERRLETAAQGSAFLAAVAAAWPHPALDGPARRWEGRDLAYPLALGVCAAAHGLPLRATLEGAVQAALAGLVSAALRLGLVGQSEAQRILAGLAADVLAAAHDAEGATTDDLATSFGTCAWRSDIAAMRHETQYSRLFRS